MNDTPHRSAPTAATSPSLIPSSPDNTLPQIELSIPRDVEVSDNLKDVQAIDLMHSNNALHMLYAYIPQVRSISSLCKITDTLMNVVEKRRKQMCLQYGYEGKAAQTRLLEPDD